MGIKTNIKWFCERSIKKKYLEIKAKEEYRNRRVRTKQDKKFLVKKDMPMTPEEKREVDEFWKKYEFAFKPYYLTFKAYSRRNGIFDPRYIPHGLRDVFFIQNYWADKNYMYAFQDKTYLDKYFVNIKQPESVIRKMSDIFYDKGFNLISYEEAIKTCTDIIMEGEELIFKPSGLKGGLGIEVIGRDEVERVGELLSKMESPTIVQKVIKQHPDLKRLNPGSVNSMRLTTMIYDKEFYPLAAFVKVGKAGNRVDNFFAGGVVVGMDIKTGKYYNWALTKKNERITELSNGIRLDEDDERLSFPAFQKVVETIKKCHYEVPMIKVISWDVTVDEEGNPVLIEPNFGGDLRVNQAITGPILGDMTEKVLDDMLLKKFYKNKATLNFDYREYHDHILIEKYCGLKTEVNVPETINNKPVTGIMTSAFRKNDELKHVKLPKTIENVYSRAFEFCRGMEKIEFPDGAKIAEKAVYYCGKCNKN